MEHNRFVIETMSFCQGNCSGCFFSEQERVGGSFITEPNLKKVVSFIREQAVDCQDCSINFGQGDHLAIKEHEWVYFLFHMKQFKDLNPLITITTSAIERNDLVQKRVDELYTMAIQENMKIFFAVVLDPKKLKHKAFKDRYVQNIEYIREKFGFIDLTINVGEDTLNYFPPNKLDDFLIEHKFRHLELNLIPTHNTLYKFSPYYQAILDWFVQFRGLSDGKPYLVFHHYHFNHMQKVLENASIPVVKRELEDFLFNNLYVGFDLKVSSLLSGYTGNALPLSEKTGYNIEQTIDTFNENAFHKEQSKIASSMIRNVLMDKDCSRCEYNKHCVMSGVMIFKNDVYEELQTNQHCFIGVKKLWNACKHSTEKDITGVSVDLIPKGLEQINSFGIDKSV